MIRSMTGFGRAEGRVGSRLIGVEIRSVNHRHAEVRVKVPARLAALEDPLRLRLSASVTRGRVDATVNVTGPEEIPPVEINHALVGAYLKAAAEISERHGIPGSVRLESILTLPGAVSVRSANGAVSPEDQKGIEGAFDRAIAALQQARAAEGKRLSTDIVERLRRIRKHRDAIDRRAKGLPKRTAVRLRARVEELVHGVTIDPMRLAQEVALLASRTDVTEELVRLAGHVDEALVTLRDSKEPAGKKLDFLLQEMHREANTINSKTEDLGVSRDTLAIKAEVEKIREQAQNIE
ncbi:MAG: YicC family protein [Acidobacteria bacterium]|nr:YicC family protein [Acidobacteriota bacterium]